MHNLILEATRGELLELIIQYVTQDLAGDLAGVLLAVLLLVGAGLMLLASVGLVRMPDLPTRMHASTKAGSLGAATIMLGVAVAIPEPLVLARAFAVITFLLLTAPVAAHIIGRAGYFTGVPLWEGTVKDDLAEQYDYERHTLASGSLADRHIEGWSPAEDDESRPYDPMVDDEPPSESIVKHPVEEAAADQPDTTGGEETTWGDAGAEQAEGKTHETPPPSDDDETDEAGDYAGQSPDNPTSTTDDVAATEAEQADETDETDEADEETDEADEETDETDEADETDQTAEADGEKKKDDGELEPATQ